MITIKIPEQTIVCNLGYGDINYLSTTIYDIFYDGYRHNVEHVASLVKCEVIQPPKENFTRKDIISQVVDKINKSYHNTPLLEIKKLGIVKLVIDLGIDFDTEIKPSLDLLENNITNGSCKK
jgi:hypothetical protein